MLAQEKSATNEISAILINLNFENSYLLEHRVLDEKVSKVHFPWLCTNMLHCSDLETEDLEHMLINVL